MKAELVEHWGTDLTVVNAARVSMDKESEWDLEPAADVGPDVWERVLSDRDKKLVSYLAREGHTSCFEHQGATLRLKVPIFIARQIQRHRTFSYNEISRRYVDTDPEFYWPDKWRKRADNVKQGSSDEEVVTGWWRAADNSYPVQERVEEHLAMTVELYEDMLKAGVAPELARMILPQNMYTEFYMTGNLRAWAHFLNLRLDAHAQKEVRDVAEQVRDTLVPLWPVSMEALLENSAG